MTLSSKHLDNYSVQSQHEPYSKANQCNRPTYSRSLSDSQCQLADGEVTRCSQHLEKSASFQQDEFEIPNEYNMPPCSRRLFELQH